MLPVSNRARGYTLAGNNSATPWTVSSVPGIGHPGPRAWGLVRALVECVRAASATIGLIRIFRPTTIQVHREGFNSGTCEAIWSSIIMATRRSTWKNVAVFLGEITFSNSGMNLWRNSVLSWSSANHRLMKLSA